jgi:hypothetical protein
MLDLSSLGQDGIIIQYEDLISMIGFNVARRFRSQGISKKLDSTSIEDVLKSYLSRPNEDYSIWLKNEYGITVDPKEMLDSFLAMQPNLLYSYKVFQAAYDQRRKNLYIYSNEYSKIAEEATRSYGFDGVAYIFGDALGDFINTHPNFTYLTSSMSCIRKVCELEAPLCLVLCDDYRYLAEQVIGKDIEKTLQEKNNIILRYTSVLSGGII